MGRSRKPLRRFPLDHEVGVLRPRISLDKPPDDCGSPIERNVPQDLVGDIGQPKAQKVGPDNRDTGVSQEARAKRLGQCSVELYGDDLTASTRQFSSENTTARPDLDNQILA